MSATLYVGWRDGGFWAYDAVSAVFLKQLIEAATSHLQSHHAPWLAHAVDQWRFNAVCSDCGLFLDETWSAGQLATFTTLVREACGELSKREKIAADEIHSWQMLDTPHGCCFARGLPYVTTASAIRLGEAILTLIDGTLPEPPPNTWWFFATEGSDDILQKCVN